MSKLVFQKLRYKNIAAVGETFIEIDLQAAHLSIIVGKNGAGKSTMLDAMAFVLYGKPFRDVTKPELPNRTNRGGLLVEIELTASGTPYVIRRGIKPDVLEVIENGTPWQNTGLKTMQPEIERVILRTSFKTFCQSVIVSTMNYTPFMRLDAAKRRSFVEDMLDCEVFRIMADANKADLAKNKTLTQKAEVDVEIVETKIEGQLEKIKALQEQSDSHLQALKDELRAGMASVKSYEDEETSKKAALEAFMAGEGLPLTDKEAVRATSARISDINGEIRELRVRIRPHNENIAFFEHNENCPTCSQGISDAFRKEKIDGVKSEITNLEIHIDQLNEELKEATANEARYKVLKEKQSELDNEVYMAGVQVNFSKKELKRISEKIKSHNERSAVAIDEDELEDLRSKRTIISGAISSLNREREVLMTCAALLKDDGIKASIIDQYIPIINTLITQNLHQMELFINFRLDNTFKETIFDASGNEVSFGAFSEGEKLRINMAILLAWRSVAKMRNVASANILFLDEIMDSSMDVDGIGGLTEAIRSIYPNDHIFVVSHRGDEYEEQFDRRLVMTKVKGFTVLTEE